MVSLESAPARPEARPRARAMLLAAAVLAALTVVMFLTAPLDGAFWWSEAPRNALNGAFILDLLRDFPIDDPVGYAYDYYLQYPALTVLLYPPLLHAMIAPFMAVLGVSHAAALAPVMLCYFALALGGYALARRWLEPAFALATAVAFAGAPVVALWGRQVMLEIPSFAFLIWSVWCLLRHLDHGRPAPLHASALLMVAALYTKLSVVFMLPVLAVGLLAWRGPAALRDRHVWIAAGVSAVLLLPLLAMTLHFGAFNVQSVTGISDAHVEKWSLAGWTWYLRQLPDQLTLLTVLLAGGYLLGAAARPSWRLPWRDSLLLGTWLGFGYLFFSYIDLKEARLNQYILYPLVLAAVLALRCALAERWARPAALVLAAAVVAITLARHPVPFMAGYREAAEIIVDRAPEGSAVLFSGRRDGSFIFNLRVVDEDGDLHVLRSDKLLLRYAIRRELGVEEFDHTEDEIADMLNRFGVHYVVAQTDFWTDLAPMDRLQRVLRSDRFETVARLPVRANADVEDKELVIYRNLGPVSETPERPTVDLTVIDRTIGASP